MRPHTSRQQCHSTHITSTVSLHTRQVNSLTPHTSSQQSHSTHVQSTVSLHYVTSIVSLHTCPVNSVTPHTYSQQCHSTMSRQQCHSTMSCQQCHSTYTRTSWSQAKYWPKGIPLEGTELQVTAEARGPQMYSHSREEKRPLVEETVVEVVLLLQTALEGEMGEGGGGTGEKGGGRRNRECCNWICFKYVQCCYCHTPYSN